MPVVHWAKGVVFVERRRGTGSVAAVKVLPSVSESPAPPASARAELFMTEAARKVGDAILDDERQAASLGVAPLPSFVAPVPDLTSVGRTTADEQAHLDVRIDPLLSLQQQAELKALVHEFRDCFWTSDSAERGAATCQVSDICCAGEEWRRVAHSGGWCAASGTKETRGFGVSDRASGVVEEARSSGAV
jgi:hypothetical protein